MGRANSSTRHKSPLFTQKSQIRPFSIYICVTLPNLFCEDASSELVTRRFRAELRNSQSSGARWAQRDFSVPEADLALLERRQA